jgi:hypothetical protein
LHSFEGHSDLRRILMPYDCRAPLRGTIPDTKSWFSFNYDEIARKPTLGSNTSGPFSDYRDGNYLRRQCLKNRDYLDGSAPVSNRALEGETVLLNMGPQHPTHGVLRLLLELDGESVVYILILASSHQH